MTYDCLTLLRTFCQLEPVDSNFSIILEAKIVMLLTSQQKTLCAPWTFVDLFAETVVIGFAFISSEPPYASWVCLV